jgi:hypothetical protein
MFAFRYASPKRKDHLAKTSAVPITMPRPRGPQKLFGQNPPPPHQEDRCDDSSVDMSLYTTRSKSTIQYHGHRTDDYESQSQVATEYTAEVDLMRYAKLGGLAAKVEEQRTKVDDTSSPITSTTEYMAPSDEELSLDSLGYDLLHMRSTEKIAKISSQFNFKEKAPLTTRSIQSTHVDSDERHHVKKLFQSTHVESDEQDNVYMSLPSTPSRHNLYFGPVDLDESIADSVSIASSSNSWVKSPSGMASPAFYQKSSNFFDDRDSSASSAEDQQPQQPENSSVVSPAPIVQSEDDDSQEYPYRVWTDDEGEEEEDQDVSGFLHQTRCQWSHDDEEVLSRTYQQTMSSISYAKRTHTPERVLKGDSEEDDEKKVYSPGAVLLTEEELGNHSNQVQIAQPLPSSSIEGYDSWRRKQEYQARYFAMLQEKAAERKRQNEIADRRSPPPSTRLNTSIDHRQQHEHRHRPQLQRRGIGDASNLRDSTRSAMDQSMDSSIPTLEAASPKPRHRRERKPPHRRRWRLLSLFRSPRKKKKKPSSSKEKKNGKKYNPTFIRISSDEPSEVDEFSLAPWPKVGHVALGSSLPGGETLGATDSPHMDQYNSGPEQLPFRCFEEEEFQKQRQVEMNKEREEQIEQEREEQIEQERIEKLKQQELERQRRLNLEQERPPRRPRATDSSFGQASTTKSDVSSAHSKLHNHIMKSSSRDTASTGCPSEDSVIDQGVSVSLHSKQSLGSSLQSRSTTVLSPCVICNGAERTHIAMPCMHYSFCGTCVERLYESEDPSCPVCNTKNVAFTKVFTG